VALDDTLAVFGLMKRVRLDEESRDHVRASLSHEARISSSQLIDAIGS